MKNLLGVLAFAGGALIGAAALANEKSDEAGADPRIGEEVNRICFARTIDSWRSIKGDDAVLLRSGVRDWYRVEFAGACRERDFRFANAIALETRPGGGCVGRGDVVIVRSPGDFQNRCFITRMNKWDPDAAAPESEEEDADA